VGGPGLGRRGQRVSRGAARHRLGRQTGIGSAQLWSRRSASRRDGNGRNPFGASALWKSNWSRPAVLALDSDEG
jgi:hypothetical protein